MKKLLVTLSLISAFSAFAADTVSTTALSVELDGPVRTNAPLGLSDFTGIASTALLWKAKSLLFPANIKAMTATFREIEGGTHGIANVFHGLTDRIQRDHGVDITDRAPMLVDCFSKPEVSAAALTALRQLKERERCVILGSTHFDARHFEADQAKWGEVSPEEVFDGYVVSRFNHLPKADYQGGEYTLRDGKVYMVNAADAVLPKEEVKGYAVKTGKYFDVVRAAGQGVRESVTNFVHVDSSQACVDQADAQDNFRGVLYSGSSDQFKTVLVAPGAGAGLEEVD